VGMLPNESRLSTAKISCFAANAISEQRGRQFSWLPLLIFQGWTGKQRLPSVHRLTSRLRACERPVNSAPAYVEAVGNVCRSFGRSPWFIKILLSRKHLLPQPRPNHLLWGLGHGHAHRQCDARGDAPDRVRGRAELRFVRCCKFRHCLSLDPTKANDSRPANCTGFRSSPPLQESGPVCKSALSAAQK
jgi:hypothetical protein